ncbi:MAG: HlyD family efflux transporter periplasmic adaptor subunit [Gammaproteobacteria bacterium]|nr:HlyD family efflux transporter periplasmic adaptor subunit [Gammaproteobacteria bacterium]
MQSSTPQSEQSTGTAASVKPAQSGRGDGIGLRVVRDAETDRNIALVAELAPSFLEWQCRMIAGVMRGAVYLSDADHRAGPMCARWPQAGEVSVMLQEMAVEVLSTGKPKLSSQIPYTGKKGQLCDAVACPIVHNGRVVATVCVALATRALPQQKAVMQLVEWGVNWFATLLNRESRSARLRAPLLLDLIKATIDKNNLHDMATAAVALLAERTSCKRVSLATSNGAKLNLLAVSGLDDFDQRTRFATRLEDAMEEASDQNMAIEHPTQKSGMAPIIRAHEKLADATPNSTFYTVVAGHGTTRVGLVFEQGGGRAFDPPQTGLFDDAAAMLAQAAGLIYAASGSLGSVVRRGKQGIIKRFRGRAGLIALLCISGIGAAALVPATHRVTADAELVSFEQRAVVASIAGYVESANVRPGDDVKKGDLLAALDTRDLRLQAAKWRSMRGARQAEYQDVLANRDRTQISVQRARLDQIDAEIELVEGQIARAQLRAPYAGVVISGDLSQALDAPVEQGQVLFEIAPLSGYRVIIEVNEYDIASVETGFEGYLRLAALPSRAIPFVIERILPVAASGDGHSFFRVEARLDEQIPELRPGMRGVAKISAGQKSLLWAWTHEVTDRLRLFVWSLGF